MSIDHKYLVSRGDTDDEYGLFIMEAEEVKTEKEMYLVYFFDENHFTHIKHKYLKLFIIPSKLNSCTDEFGNKYTGKSLEMRLKEEVKAFKEELPGWKKYLKESDEHLSSLE